MQVQKTLETVIQRLKEMKLEDNILCRPFWFQLMALEKLFKTDPQEAENKAWAFFRDNAQWVFVNKVMSKADLLEWFDIETLNRQGFYIDQSGLDINNGVGAMFDCQGKIKGHSLFCCFGPKTRVEAFDTTVINLFAGRCEARDCFVFAFGDSFVKMAGYGKVEAFDNSTVALSGYSYGIINESSSYSKTPNSHAIQI